MFKTCGPRSVLLAPQKQASASSTPLLVRGGESQGAQKGPISGHLRVDRCCISGTHEVLQQDFTLVRLHGVDDALDVLWAQP